MSREAVWRHLTRVPDWPRWFPGLHGVDTADTIHRSGLSWRSSGQMGRFPYRSNQQVSVYRLLCELEIDGDRRPWLHEIRTSFRIQVEGTKSRLVVTILARPRFSFICRLLLSGLLRRRLQREADEIAGRLRSYVERTTPSH